MIDDKVIRPDQVMKRLLCSRSMVYKLLRNGGLKGFKVGASWRVFEKSVHEYIKTSHS